MRAVFGGSLAGARKIDGHVLQRADKPDKIAQRPAAERQLEPIRFRDLAVMAFPSKTESHLAFLARVDARTARRWLADDNEPPAEVLGIILAEIMRRFHQRS